MFGGNYLGLFMGYVYGLIFLLLVGRSFLLSEVHCFYWRMGFLERDFMEVSLGMFFFYSRKPPAAKCQLKTSEIVYPAFRNSGNLLVGVQRYVL